MTETSPRAADGANERLARLGAKIDDEALDAVSPFAGDVHRYPSKCLHQMFEEQVVMSPDAAAVACGDGVLSYQEVERAANRLARRLREAGIGREDRVALYLTRRAELVVGIVGILKAGAAYVPIDPGHPEERVRFILEDCGAAAVVTEQSLSQWVPRSVESLDIDRVLEAPASDDDDTRVDAASDPSDLAYVIYTSGSTGTPKAWANRAVRAMGGIGASVTMSVPGGPPASLLESVNDPAYSAAEHPPGAPRAALAPVSPQHGVRSVPLVWAPCRSPVDQLSSQ